MKIAVTGKGGVGKTTLSALLASTFAQRGMEVFAIDADPDANLAGTLGYADADSIRPLVELKELIAERTGVEPGTTGGMFRLNPFVSDIPETYAVDIGGVHVLVAGAVKKGGAGCYCPENAMIRALVSHLLVERDTAVVLDMEAGIEHLSRGTVAAVDCLVVVLEPSRRSVETAGRIRRLANEIGIGRVVAVGNKIRTDTDRAFLESALPDLDFVGFLPYDNTIRESDISGVTIVGVSEDIGLCVGSIADALEGTGASE